MKTERTAYIPPQVEVITMDMEGTVMTASNFGGDDAFTRSSGSYSAPVNRQGYSSASSSDLEDLINDILTVEQ